MTNQITDTKLLKNQILGNQIVGIPLCQSTFRTLPMYITACLLNLHSNFSTNLNINLKFNCITFQKSCRFAESLPTTMESSRFADESLNLRALASSYSQGAQTLYLGYYSVRIFI